MWQQQRPASLFLRAYMNDQQHLQPSRQVVFRKLCGLCQATKRPQQGPVLHWTLHLHVYYEALKPAAIKTILYKTIFTYKPLDLAYQTYPRCLCFDDQSYQKLFGELEMKSHSISITCPSFGNFVYIAICLYSYMNWFLVVG